MQRNKRKEEKKKRFALFEGQSVKGDCPLGRMRILGEGDAHAASSCAVCVHAAKRFTPPPPPFISSPSLLPPFLHHLNTASLHHRLTAHMSSLQQPSPATTGAASSALDSDSVLTLLQSLLPAQPTQGQQGTDSASSDARTPESTVVLGSPYEGLASLSHAIMTAVGFRLVGLGEDDSLENDRRTIDGKTFALEIKNSFQCGPMGC